MGVRPISCVAVLVVGCIKGGKVSERSQQRMTVVGARGCNKRRASSCVHAPLASTPAAGRQTGGASLSVFDSNQGRRQWDPTDRFLPGLVDSALLLASYGPHSRMGDLLGSLGWGASREAPASNHTRSRRLELAYRSNANDPNNHSI